MSSPSVHSKLNSQTTRSPGGSTRSSRSPSMRGHDDLTDTCKHTQTRIGINNPARLYTHTHTKCHITPSSTKCFKLSDHFMCNLHNYKRKTSHEEIHTVKYMHHTDIRSYKIFRIFQQVSIIMACSRIHVHYYSSVHDRVAANCTGSMLGLHNPNASICTEARRACAPGAADATSAPG